MYLYVPSPKKHKSHPQELLKHYQFCPKCGAGDATSWSTCFYVCQDCHAHLAMPVRERLRQFFDHGLWEEYFDGLASTDPLTFYDRMSYLDRLKQAKEKSQVSEALVVARGQLDGLEIVVAAFSFEFIGGSMGVVVGERFVKAVEMCIERKCPLIAFVASGGARMQEGVWSLVQMSRVSAAIDRLQKHGILYMTCLTHPTTGGVAASLAMLGDWIVSEPDAYISFTGSRVIGVKKTEQVSSPVQLLKLGHIDAIVPRFEQRAYFSKRLRLLNPAK